MTPDPKPVPPEGFKLLDNEWLKTNRCPYNAQCKHVNWELWYAAPSGGMIDWANLSSDWIYAAPITPAPEASEVERLRARVGEMEGQLKADLTVLESTGRTFNASAATLRANHLRNFMESHYCIPLTPAPEASEVGGCGPKSGYCAECGTSDGPLVLLEDTTLCEDCNMADHVAKHRIIDQLKSEVARLRADVENMRTCGISGIHSAQEKEIAALRADRDALRALITELVERREDPHGFYYVSRFMGGMGSEISRKIESLTPKPEPEQISNDDSGVEGHAAKDQPVIQQPSGLGKNLLPADSRSGRCSEPTNSENQASPIVTLCSSCHVNPRITRFPSELCEGCNSQKNE